MTEPRSVEERLAWFDNNRPTAVGLCAAYTQEACRVPKWGAPDANAVVRLMRDAGQLHTDDNPPRGAICLWTSSTHGHMCLSLGNRRIISTDYPGARDTGEASITMPREKWGHKWAGWSDYYAGVRLPMDGATDMDIYNYAYSGKSDDIKEIPLNEYVWVTKDTDDPTASGLEFKLIYLNVKLRWTGPGFGNIRVKFIREGDDATAYQDYLVHSDQEEFLLTHMHMEAGQAGIGGKWYVKITGPTLASTAVSTRYNKYATVKDKG